MWPSRGSQATQRWQRWSAVSSPQPITPKVPASNGLFLHDRLQELARQREAELDFTHPTFRTGLDILVRTEGSVTWRTITSVLTPGNLSIMALLLLLICIEEHEGARGKGQPVVRGMQIGFAHVFLSNFQLTSSRITLA